MIMLNQSFDSVLVLLNSIILFQSFDFVSKLIFTKSWFGILQQGRIRDFLNEGDFCKKGVTIHCLITKICELGACFLYFSYVLAQNGG